MRHRDVEDADVGLLAQGKLDRGSTVGGLRHDLDAGLFQRLSHVRPGRRVIVGYQHTQLALSLLAGHRRMVVTIGYGVNAAGV